MELGLLLTPVDAPQRELFIRGLESAVALLALRQLNFCVRPVLMVNPAVF